MIILGFRRDDARDLACYLLRQGENEEITIREMSHFPLQPLTRENVLNAFRLMEAQTVLKGSLRSLYHVVLSLRENESLNSDQLQMAVTCIAANFGLSQHQRIVVQHKKQGKSHFHIAFNLIHPATGKLAALQWTDRIRRKTAIQLAELFGFEAPPPRVWPIRRWEYNRGKKSGIDPLLMRREVTSIYRRSSTGEEFRNQLGAAGLILSKGRYENYILIDRARDIHGLIRRLEGVTLSEFEKKFPDLKNMALTPLDAIPGIKKRVRHKDLNRNVIAFRRYAKRLTAKPKLKGNASKVLSSNTPVLLHRSPLALMLAKSRARHRGGASEPDSIYFTPASNGKRHENIPDSEKHRLPYAEMSSEELLAFAFANKRFDILAEFGIYLSDETTEPRWSV